MVSEKEQLIAPSTIATLTEILVDLQKLASLQTTLTRLDLERHFRVHAASAGIVFFGASLILIGSIVFCEAAALYLHWLWADPVSTVTPLWIAFATVSLSMITCGLGLAIWGIRRFAHQLPLLDPNASRESRTPK